MHETHQDWPRDVLTAENVKDIKLGVWDLRYTPTVLTKSMRTPANPYFAAAVNSFQEKGQPSLEDIPVWVLICSDLTEQTQALHFIDSHPVLKEYSMSYSNYMPSPNERMGDLSARSKKAVDRIYLTTLQSPRNTNMVKMRSEYDAPNTDTFTRPGAYNELEFRIHNTELRMEFLLNLVKMFCAPGASVMSFFAGSKFTCAAMVSLSSVHCLACITNLDLSMVKIGLIL